MEHLDNKAQEYNAVGTTFESGDSAFDDAAQEKNDRLFERGTKWLVVGVFLMASSFAINYFLFGSGTSFAVIMYVLTSLGALCIMKCLADIFGF